MITSKINKLKKLGFKNTDSKSLADYLPTNIWISQNEIHLKRQKAKFVIVKSSAGWAVSVSVTDPKTKEIYILHRVVFPELDESISEMLFFLVENKMLIVDHA